MLIEIGIYQLLWKEICQIPSNILFQRGTGLPEADPEIRMSCACDLLGNCSLVTDGRIEEVGQLRGHDHRPSHARGCLGLWNMTTLQGCSDVRLGSWAFMLCIYQALVKGWAVCRHRSSITWKVSAKEELQVVAVRSKSSVRPHNWGKHCKSIWVKH